MSSKWFRTMYFSSAHDLDMFGVFVAARCFAERVHANRNSFLTFSVYSLRLIMYIMLNIMSAVKVFLVRHVIIMSIEQHTLEALNT